SHPGPDGLGVRSGNEDAAWVGQCRFPECPSRSYVPCYAVLRSQCQSVPAPGVQCAYDRHSAAKNHGAVSSPAPDARGETGRLASPDTGATHSRDTGYCDLLQPPGTVVCPKRT